MIVQKSTRSIAGPTFTAARLHRFSVDAYHRMIETGILTEDDRVELLDGHILAKMTTGPAHSVVVHKIHRLLEPLVGTNWHTRMQSPITLPGSEPEPDLAVVRGQIENFLHRHPMPGEIGLLVEVADPSLRIDRTEKLAIYAAAGIQEYWIVNLIDRQVEAFREPQPVGASCPAEYASREIFDQHSRISMRLDGVSCTGIGVFELLP